MSETREERMARQAHEAQKHIMALEAVIAHTDAELDLGGVPRDAETPDGAPSDHPAWRVFILRLERDQLRKENAALLAAVEGLVAWMDPDYDALAAEFHRETGMMAPGKDEPAAMNSGHTYEERRQRWSEWCGVRRAALLSQARAAVALVKGSEVES